MSRKSKGINAERDLVHRFWNEKWACIRVAGSGSCVYPSPDIIASNKLRTLAIECKTSASKTKYLSIEEVQCLQSFCESFGAEAWIAIRFDRSNWHFLSLNDLKNSGKSYVITLDAVKNMGLIFEELIK
jgi:Holliday junction resolvase